MIKINRTCILVILISKCITEKNLTLMNQWNNYKTKLNLMFSVAEEAKRQRVFRENLEYIKNFNSKRNNYRLEANCFAHLTHEEYVMQMGHAFNYQPENDDIFFFNSMNTKIMSDKWNLAIEDRDWRKEGKVTDMKDQKSCGAGYAFASAASVESANAIKINHLKELGVQELIDCTEEYGNEGCNRGLMYNSFKYLIAEGVFPSIYYPFREKQQSCQKNKRNRREAVKISYVSYVPYKDEDTLSLFISRRGPVGVAIDASPRSFQFYHSGIYDSFDCNSRSLNHHVLAVGIGSEPEPFYILKNSFGTCWGEQGYMKLRRYNENQCGVATSAMMPVII